MNIGEGKRKKGERERNHERLLPTENRLRVAGGTWVGDGLGGEWAPPIGMYAMNP